MRVLVTGMGGVLGTKVAQMLEARDDVEEVAGCDFAPPRRRLRRAAFTRIDPTDRDRLTAFVTDFAWLQVVLDRRSPMEALTRSFEAHRSHRASS